jgi:hypothetical protein
MGKAKEEPSCLVGLPRLAGWNIGTEGMQGNRASNFYLGCNLDKANKVTFVWAVARTYGGLWLERGRATQRYLGLWNHWL